MAFILIALSIGFLGSFHCIGMCGPIALALPVHHKALREKITSILLYNFGRITTYALLGAVFGMIGESFAFFGYQQKLSIAAGVIVLLIVLTPRSLVSRSSLMTKFYTIFNGVKSKLSQQFHKSGSKSFFIIGLLNGLLPCGLVYMAIAGAVATGNIAKGAMFMAAFGSATLPFMFTISYSSQLMSVNARNLIRKSVPFVVGAMAILLILRGMNLGIKYISPKLTETTTECHGQLKCCHK